ncbi:contractile injection system protein, VgrG/Pvc8 family [Thioclava sp. A2]|uniref:contractile injection system protein, VgrG/Pvc8 family n=1 Tax=Thioclava sp. FCG-A2 TaxID=3080562 RepID=UPI002953408F|nr:contractile injection system protein, VgrG/Pvc8 family [Thioclava sp. A2]MDV7271413.1 contractile injection system protein, VgrG/Pvc8 family [Thioclava sp. A2]
MHVAYQIIADGTDVTSNFQDRLISLTITDEAGQKSDTAEIVINDRDYLVALPKTGAKLQIAMGFKGDLVDLGTFVVDDVSGQLAPDTMTISAKAADMLGGIRARKTRSWFKVTIADIVDKIAGEHGLKPLVSEGLKACSYAYQAQTSESDLNFLTRLAKGLDAVAKPAGGYLIFSKRGEGKAADGSELPVFVVDRRQMKGGSWQITGRGKYGRVTAEWGERGTATTHKVTAGDKEPELALRHRHPTEAEAQNAVDAALARSRRARGKISIELGGFWGDLMAEAKVDLQGIKPELTGEWLITRVQHRLSNTLTTSFDAERDNEG